MKLSMETYAVREKFGDIEAIRLIKEAGFDAIDFSFYWANEDVPLLGENYREYAKTIRWALDKNGLACNQAHAPFEFQYGEKMDASESHYLEIRRSVEAASILGAKSIVIHSVSVPANRDFEEYNLCYYKSFEPLCKKFGIQIAVENLFVHDKKCNSFFGRLGTPKQLCDFIVKLNSPWFVACLDIGHAAITGMAPEDFILGMKNGLLKSLHIQDTDYLADRHVLPFMGKLDWDAIISALKEVEYDGELTFEVFWFIKKLPKKLVPDSLTYAASVGRFLISRFENG